jgi:hypothetical protein
MMERVYGHWNDPKWLTNPKFARQRMGRNWGIYLSNLYMNMFEWTGMPDTVNLRFLEETLFTEGRALFFKDKDSGKFMALPCVGESGVNVYQEYTAYRAVSMNYSKKYSSDESVLIRENQSLLPPIRMLEMWVVQIVDAAQAISVYARTMKKPWLVAADRDENVTFKTLISAIDANELSVVASPRAVEGISRAFGNPQDGPGLMALWRNKHELLDEVLTFMGINNANTDKRERLITSEVEANSQLVMLNVDTALDWRLQACEEINAMFGLNVSCQLKHDYLIDDNEESEDDDSSDNDSA